MVPVSIVIIAKNKAALIAGCNKTAGVHNAGGYKHPYTFAYHFLWADMLYGS
jgi:hypothetical protein